jgi:peptide/nickel transport system substrate-binding protein
VLLAWKRILDRVGIDMSIRQVDSAQFERRRQGFEFDMMPMVWGSSLSPGNEQSFRWGSRAADQTGSFNLAGLKSPAADAMIAQILSALTREDLVAAVRSLDRVLMSAQIALPLYHLPEQRIARWTTMARPERPALSGQAIDAWWRARP